MKLTIDIRALAARAAALLATPAPPPYRPEAQAYPTTPLWILHAR